MRNGLTGLTYREELGVAHPSAYTLICGTAIDLYFTVGGVLFLAAAIAHRRSRHRAAHPSWDDSGRQSVKPGDAARPHGDHIERGGRLPA